ncbi:MAG TPA: EAL domain-containing protein [Geopsychrobacteraceae bacterium]|jgi:diguanylate cyclase (GGDEF)-like protein/PAS domain S-box-containing protein
MSRLEIISIVLVAIGAVVMLFPIAVSMRIRARVPAPLRGKWLLLIWLMGFFFVGYLVYIASQFSFGTFPHQLVTGTIFMGGAFFVYRVISISSVTINDIRYKNKALENEIQERSQRESDQRRYEVGLEVLDASNRKLILTAGDAESFNKTLCASVKDIVKADIALVLTLNDGEETFSYHEALGERSELIAGQTVSHDEGGICGLMFRKGETVYIPDLNDSPHTNRQLAAQLGVSTGLVAPLWQSDRIVGGLTAFRREASFDEIDSQLLTLFSQRASIALQNMKILTDLENRVQARTTELNAQNKLLEKIISHIPSHVFWQDRHSNYLGCNPGFARLVGLDGPADVSGKSDFDFPWSRPAAEKNRRESEAVIASGRSVLHREVSEFGENTEPRHYLNSRIALKNAAGQVTGVLGIIDDVTERKKVERVVAAERSFLQAVIDGVVDPTFVIGLDYKIRLMNRAAKGNLPDSALQNSGLCCYQVSHHQDTPCDGRDHPCPLAMVRDSGQAATVVHQHWLPDGEMRSFELLASPLWDEAGQLTGIIESARDITDRLKVEEDLRENQKHLDFLAHHDSLTELPNRLLLNDRLQHAMGNATRTGQSLALLFIDLDRFKTINDSLGHELGDELLLEVAKRLHGCLREPDTLARMGGDEFVVILERVEGPQQASVVARKLLDCFARSFLLSGHEVFTTSSIGISLYPEDGLDVKELMKSADVAMYRAKASGRNNFQFYKPEMNARTHDRLLMENSLRKALEENHFLLYYQPQINMVTGQLTGMEALIRWQPPGQRMVSPGEFIPLAEETGLILPIGEWVLRTACRQICHWQQAGLDPVRLSVNISALQFNQIDFLDVVDRILAETGIDPQWLELELTESAMMENVEATISSLDQLKRRGFHLSIDDFGTGYSSLSYLKRLAITKLKIDRSFVRDITIDQDNAAITSAIIALGQSLQLEVLAEGVETEEQTEFLLLRGCRLGQGFLYSRPVPAAQMEALLQRRKTVV